MKIIITAGGTGGHIYPGLALADQIKRELPESEILFIGSEEGLEKDLVPRAGYQLRLIKARALLRKISLRTMAAPFIMIYGFGQALKIMREFGPQVVISTGGYASLASVAAAKIMGKPVLIHEQNVLPGLVNRLCGRFADRVCLSWPESLAFGAGLVTGNPVRRAIIDADRDAARRKFGLTPANRFIVVMGGSQGARTINEAVLAAVPEIKKRRDQQPALQAVKLFHLFGKRDAKIYEQRLQEAAADFYEPAEYLYNMEEVLAAADLVISRAGATAIAEFMVRGLPMVLVPFPFSADNHQVLNAAAVVKGGAGMMISNEMFTKEKIVEILTDGLDLKSLSVAARKMAKPEAAKRIVDLLVQINES